MSRILAVANIKGGVGKTTTVVNLSAALAERDFRVLAIDLDPQSSLTMSMGVRPEQVSVTIRQMLETGSAALWPIRETLEHWDFIPANVDLRVLEHELETNPHKIPKVAAGLQPLREKYDFILLDCPASAGPLIGAALAAADQVIIPLTPDFLAFQVSRSLFRIIRAIRQNINPRLRIAGIFLTMYDTRTRHARDFMTVIHETYEDVPFFSAVVRQSVKVKEAPSQGQSVLRYAPDSQAAKAYRVIAAEIVNGIAASVPAVIATAPAEAEKSPAPQVAASEKITERKLPVALPVAAGASLAPMIVSSDTANGRIPAIPMIVATSPAPGQTAVSDTSSGRVPAIPMVVAAGAASAAAAPTNFLVLNSDATALTVPAFLTRSNASATLPRVEVSPAQNGGKSPTNRNGANGHHGNPAPRVEFHEVGPEFKLPTDKTALDEKPKIMVKPPAEALPADPHKAMRAVLKQATADSGGVGLERDLDLQVEHVLFVSTADDVPDLIQDGSVLVEGGFSAYAEQMFQRVTELAPAQHEGWLGWARITSDPLQRVTLLQKAIYLKPGRELRGELGIARQQLQEHAYVLLEEGTARSDAEKMAKSHELFRHAVTIDPSDERAWLGCARTADNLVEKMSYLKQALKINPQNKDALELSAIVGAFVKGEPTERWLLKNSRKKTLVLGLVLIALLGVFMALPWIFPPR